MDTLDKKPLDQRVIILLRRLGHYLYYRVGGRNGRRRVLSQLKAQGPMAQRTLQELLHLRAGSLSEVIIRLEAEGLLTKVRSSKDARRWELALTPTGRAEADRLETAYEAQVARMMAGLSAEELAQLEQILSKLLRQWETLEAEEGGMHHDS